jgi:O-antigen ligase
MGSVHPWAYVPLWCAAAVCAGLLAVRAGAHRKPGAPSPDRPGRRRAPLLLPGLAMAAWAAVQLLPLPPSGAPLTASRGDTLRGIAFVASLLSFHLAAVVVLEERAARVRFRRGVMVLGVVLAVLAIVQLAAGTGRIYGVFTPLEHGIAFGPFPNRNHFAGYMLMVIPVGLAVLSREAQAWRRGLGLRPPWRQRLLQLSSPSGSRVLMGAAAVLAATCALVASSSRGALCAFAAALMLGALTARRRQAPPAWTLALAFVVMALAWLGTERLEIRFGRVVADAPGRTLVWRDTLARMQGRWLTGSGFNTFETAFSRVEPFALPAGATAWPASFLAQAEAVGGRPGVRALAGEKRRGWYREAHNDYLQLLAETGVPGLLIGLWAAAAALRAVRRDPWILAAVAGVLLHALVDFDFQIPALSVLFVVLAAMRT